MTDGADRTSQGPRRTIALLLVAMAGTQAWDLFTDSPLVLTNLHILVELASIVLGATAAWLLWRGWDQAERSLGDVRRTLAERQTERDQWRQRAQTALQGLGEAMDAQFAAWQLTPAEKETAMLLLKGLSHKDVAVATNRSERTVRQHAISVYRKSGLAGRAELAAFFFEDMMLPPSADPGSATDERPAS
jgi:DNA-binding CsgD family transcriptional regulator